jgi:hypothetical protein
VSSPFGARTGLRPGRVSLMLDSNVWRYLVDESDVEVFALKRSARRLGIQIVACPAVAYEALLTSDERLRNRLVRAITLGSWSRLMPEAYREAAEVYCVVSQHRPQWIRHNGDVSYWYRLQADWSGGGWWRRARRNPESEASASYLCFVVRWPKPSQLVVFLIATLRSLHARPHSSANRPRVHFRVP